MNDMPTNLEIDCEFWKKLIEEEQRDKDKLTTIVNVKLTNHGDGEVVKQLKEMIKDREERIKKFEECLKNRCGNQ